MELLLQLGADVDSRNANGDAAIDMLFSCTLECLTIDREDAHNKLKLLLSWGATLFVPHSRELFIFLTLNNGKHGLVSLIGSELGGRRCKIANLSSRPELNGKTCVADEYLPDTDQYKVTLESNEEVLVLDPGNLKRRDHTPEDCGYYIRFKKGHGTIRHDFHSNEDCQDFAAYHNRDKSRAVETWTEEEKDIARWVAQSDEMSL